MRVDGTTPIAEVIPLAVEDSIAVNGLEPTRWIVTFPGSPTATSPSHISLEVTFAREPPTGISWLPVDLEPDPAPDRSAWMAHEDRERTTVELEEPLRTYHAFFNDLQAATEPALVQNAPPEHTAVRSIRYLLPWLRNVHGLVRRSLFRRVRHVLSTALEPDRVPRALPSLYQPHETEPIARLAEELFENPAVCAWSTLPIDTFGRAFEAFALGDLRVRSRDVVCNAEPNSGYFYLFAEFSFAVAVILGERRGHAHPTVVRWRAQCARLVLAEHLFLATYSPRDGLPLAFESYGPGTYDPHGRERMTPEVVERVRTNYTDLVRDDSPESWAHLQERHALLASQGLSTWHPAAKRLREELIGHG